MVIPTIIGISLVVVYLHSGFWVIGVTMLPLFGATYVLVSITINIHKILQDQNTKLVMNRKMRYAICFITISQVLNHALWTIAELACRVENSHDPDAILRIQLEHSVIFNIAYSW